MFSCKKCTAQFPKWSGRCPECQAWGTIQEDGESQDLPQTQERRGKVTPSRPIGAPAEKAKRLPTGNVECDRVLGGGIIPGSLILLSGEPGIGKSTLVASLAGSLSTPGCVLYVSGEESESQLSARFQRLGLPLENLRYLEAGSVENLVATVEQEKPLLVIVDSMQTLGSSSIESGPGSPTLVRYATNLLLQTSKRTGIPFLLIGQVTKDGSLAGPKTMEHLVDVVLTLEGDPLHAFRLLRSTKNRFGSTAEVGVFEMGGGGLIPVQNPSQRFLSERISTPGSVITATLEGSRVFLVEVQALVEKSTYPNPIRRASGFDTNRLQMLCAILSKRLGLRLGDQDIYLNVVGGMRLEEPAADLAVCAAILSALDGKAPTKAVIYTGEVGLGGEVRSIPACDRRLSEAARMGMEEAFVPTRDVPHEGIANLKIQGMGTIENLR